MEAGELLIKIKPHVKAFYPGSDVKKALISEDLAVSHSWNSMVLLAQEKNPDIKWSLPKEGGTAWFDNMAIFKDAPHKTTAEAFINYMLRPDVSAANSDEGATATSNHVAIAKFVAPESANNPALYPTNEELKRIEFLATMPDDILVIYDDIWTRLLGA